jgi:hypothetical protein
MADGSKTEKWLAWKRSGEMERQRALEEAVAREWWDSLSLQQREIYAELEESWHGLSQLHHDIRTARRETRRRQSEGES